MATRTILVLAVVLASFLEIQVLAQSSASPNSTVATIAPNMTVTPSTSMFIAPTSTINVVPSVSMNVTTAPPMRTTTPSPTSDIEISVVATLEGECKQNTEADVEKWVNQTVFNGNSIVKNVKVKAKPSGNNCEANITIKFRKGPVDITTLVNGSKMMLNDTKITFGSGKIYAMVDGVALQIKFIPSVEDCKAKCCDGGGGPITVEMNCKPKDKCFALKHITITKPDCSKVCPKCGGNAGITLQASLMVLIFTGLLNWFM